MTNLHKIRARIRSVNSTQQITRTMKMIAVSKLRKNGMFETKPVPWIISGQAGEAAAE